MSFLDGAIWEGRFYSGGWKAADTTAEVLAPASGATIGRLGVAGPTDVAEASRRAAAAQVDWAARSPEDRAGVLRRAGALWEAHAAEIEDLLVREGGSVPTKAALETHIAAQECYEASALPTFPQGDVLATTGERRWSLARRRPVGVVSVIAPFNFPLILSIRSVAPALALGNAVLLKPDQRTAVCGGVTLARVFEEAGLPEGLFHVLPGGAEIGQAVIEAPEVRVVSFTGSTAAGRKVGEVAARSLTRAHLELGGNNALVVLPGADVELASSAGAFGSFLHQGQICMTTGRHLVHTSLYDAYVAALSSRADKLPVGDPALAPVALGPIIDARQLAHVADVVARSVEAGARVAAGGTSEGLFYRPTVLAEVTPTTPAFAEEIFGPVAPVVPFGSLEEAISLARSSEYGLSLGILGDVGMAMTVADAVPSGIVHINEQTVLDEPNAPFGGVGASGTGSRFGGAAANVEAFTETQWLTIRPDIAPYPF